MADFDLTVADRLMPVDLGRRGDAISKNKTQLHVPMERRGNVQYIEVEKPVIKETLVEKVIEEDVYLNIPQIREVIQPVYVPVPVEQLVEVYNIVPPPCPVVKEDYRKILAEGCVKLALFVKENERLMRRVKELEALKAIQIEELSKQGKTYDPSKRHKKVNQHEAEKRSDKVQTARSGPIKDQVRYGTPVKVFTTTAEGAIIRSETTATQSRLIAENRGPATSYITINPPEPTLVAHSLSRFRSTTPPKSIIPDMQQTNIASRLMTMPREESPPRNRQSSVEQHVGMMKPWTVVIQEKVSSLNEGQVVSSNNILSGHGSGSSRILSRPSSNLQTSLALPQVKPELAPYYQKLTPTAPNARPVVQSARATIPASSTSNNHASSSTGQPQYADIAGGKTSPYLEEKPLSTSRIMNPHDLILSHNSSYQTTLNNPGITIVGKPNIWNSTTTNISVGQHTPISTGVSGFTTMLKTDMRQTSVSSTSFK